MNHLQPKRARKAMSWLSILTPAAAILSVINVSISISTSVWLKTTEQIFIVDSSNSTNHRTEVPRTKRTVSGLWRLCEYHNLTQVDTTVTNCFTIDYFSKERYTPEPHDSTMAIPYTVTKAGPLFFAASFLLVSGIMSAVLGYLWRRKRVATFIAGILFIIAGLVLLVAMVVYVSVLQAEVGQKLRRRNSLDKAVFEYQYGYSFILIVVGFMSTELTGTCAIFWYIYWHQLDWAEKKSLNGRSVNHSTNHHNHHQRQLSHSSHSRRMHIHDDYCGRGYSNLGGYGMGDPTTDMSGMGSSGAYYDRSASSGEEYKDSYQFDTRPLPFHHRHRSTSHSGVTSMPLQYPVGVSGTSNVGGGDGHMYSNYYSYSKMYPCKKHGTIPPRCSSSAISNHCNRHSYHPSGSHSTAYGPPIVAMDLASSTCPMSCPLNSSKCHKYIGNPNHHPYSYNYCSFYDDDLVPPPPPPPHPLPRDITCTTTVSGDEFFLDHGLTPTNLVTTSHPNVQNYSTRERTTPREHRKTTPV